jgi:hypothetical protein
MTEKQCWERWKENVKAQLVRNWGECNESLPEWEDAWKMSRYEGELKATTEKIGKGRTKKRRKKNQNQNAQ